MIGNELHKRPIISFGLGKTEATISLGESITIWQNKIFSDETFRLYFLDSAKPNTNNFNFEPAAIGVYNIEVVIRGKIILSEKKSNSIKLTVI